MNNGDDTEYYIKKGYRVVAVEANPSLCEHARIKFEQAIKLHRLFIHNVAVWTEYGRRSFFVNQKNDHWSSLDPGWARRDDTSCHEIVMDCVPLSHLIALHGVPLYLKIDIEGVDELVVRQLQGQEYLPLYVSMEDCRFGYEYMKALNDLGYTDFKLLDQGGLGSLTDASIGHRFRLGSSGPFGEDIPGPWLSYEDVLSEYSRRVRDRNGIRVAPCSSWWDIHCRANTKTSHLI